uniref:Small integral membrane protein 12 n=1 Tax=Gasterosteus aculeatus aculeatus TaxID=481459 RepID=G3NWY3_GASAC
MWPLFWTAARTYAPYVTFPVALVVGAVGYHLEWFIRGAPKAREEKGILELREERKLQEQEGLGWQPRVYRRCEPTVIHSDKLAD